MTRAALVTGAGGDIGLAIADELGRAGYALTITSRRTERLATAREHLQAQGHTVEATTADVRDTAAMSDLFAAHEARFGRLDVLVNNAGLGVAGEIDATPVRHLDLQIDVNLRAAVLGYHFGVPLLRRAGREHRCALVVNTASIAAWRPQPLLPLYAATKAALVGLTRAMNRDLGPAGIKSTALCPGFVASDMTAASDLDVPPEEMLSPADVAGAVGWLLTTGPTCVVPEIPFLRPGYSE